MQRTFRYEVILAGVDFSPPSRLALARALDLAGRLGAQLEVVHAVEKLRPSLPFSARNRVTVQRLQRDIVEQARVRLEQFVPARSRVDVRTRVVSGAADAVLLAQAERVSADLIVLANRGHSPLQELLIGSTAERVLRIASLPVMLVSAPPPGVLRRS